MEPNKCPRVEMRMACPECGYPESEARYMLDERLPHMQLKDKVTIDAFHHAYNNLLKRKNQHLKGA